MSTGSLSFLGHLKNATGSLSFLAKIVLGYWTQGFFSSLSFFSFSKKKPVIKANPVGAIRKHDRNLSEPGLKNCGHYIVTVMLFSNQDIIFRLEGEESKNPYSNT